MVSFLEGRHSRLQNWTGIGMHSLSWPRDRGIVLSITVVAHVLPAALGAGQDNTVLLRKRERSEGGPVGSDSSVVPAGLGAKNNPREVALEGTPAGCPLVPDLPLIAH